MVVIRTLPLVLFLATRFGTACAANESVPMLVEAAGHGDKRAVTKLLEAGANVNEQGADGATALHWLARLDEVELATQVIQAGANPNATTRFGVTPLMLAATNGGAEMVKLLLDAGADANAATPGGEPVLMMAARTGQPRAVAELLKHGAQPNVPESWRKQTALMWAAAEGHLETARLLLDAGAELNARSRGGFTAFLFAVRQGHADVVQFLLDSHANVNETLPAQSRGGWQAEETTPGGGPSALGLAILNAHYELAARLLDAGADPNYAWQGRTALHAITWVRRPGAGSNDPPPPGSGTMDSLELVRRLVKHGADVDARMTARSGGVRTVLNLRGATPFLLAARTADADLMRLLTDLGADPLIPNEENTTPLMVAAGVGVQSPGEDPGNESEVLEAVKLALELGDDVNAVDDRGETAMHGAAYKYAASSVPLLMQHGARIEVWNQKNRNGWTPLRIATGVHRAMNLRSSPKTAAAIRDVMVAAGVSTVIEPETNISGATK